MQRSPLTIGRDVFCGRMFVAEKQKKQLFSSSKLFSPRPDAARLPSDKIFKTGMVEFVHHNLQECELDGTEAPAENAVCNAAR